VSGTSRARWLIAEFPQGGKRTRGARWRSRWQYEDGRVFHLPAKPFSGRGTFRAYWPEPNSRFRHREARGPQSALVIVDFDTMLLKPPQLAATGRAFLVGAFADNASERSAKLQPESRSRPLVIPRGCPASLSPPGVAGGAE
jgi:hypothetical protein